LTADVNGQGLSTLARTAMSRSRTAMSRISLLCS
jgi:hypothetical protein